MLSHRLIPQLATLSPLAGNISKVYLTRGDIIGKTIEIETRDAVEQLRQPLTSDFGYEISSQFQLERMPSIHRRVASDIEPVPSCGEHGISDWSHKENSPMTKTIL
jgi:hypothetical protein